MFRVFEGNPETGELKPCDSEGFSWARAENGWGNSTFESFELAANYAQNWCGDFADEDHIWEVNKAYDLHDYGYVIIKEL